MEKRYQILLLLILIIFWGCETTSVIPMDPENSNQEFNYSVMTTPDTDTDTSVELSSKSTIDFPYQALSFEYREINPRMYSLEKTYFLELMQSGIVLDKLIFDKDKWKTPFAKKLDVVVKMIENLNYQGASQKIVNDLIPSSEAWVSAEHQYSVRLALEFTIYMLKTNYAQYIINIDYFDHGDNIGGYAWVQIASTGEESIFQLEGSNEVFFNDPVFWILADLPEPVNCPSALPGRIISYEPLVCD
ncbi:MAG TPA: hypothetical protein PLN58_06465 [Bacilli bacterium]|nr:hypothetical protein [Clostridiales bacterium]HQP14312.1 hypothetical protein [Bacilli bacterium]